MGVPTTAVRVSIRADGEECETPLRLMLELPADDLDVAVGSAVEAFARLGCLHPAVDQLTIVAHVVEPAEEKPEAET